MPAKRGDIELAVRRDLARLAPDARRTALAAATLELAKELDQGVELSTDILGNQREVRISARDTAALVRELRATLAALPAPVERKDSKVDDLRTRREARRAARADRRPAAEDPVGP